MKDEKHVILAVDDDPEWLDFIASAIGNEYLLKISRSADDVVSLTKEIRPSLIILDVMMQGRKDGFTIFSELQRDPDSEDIPVIIFSEVNVVTNLGFDTAGMEEYLGAKPAAFLEKPANVAKLREAVRIALKGAETIGTD